MGSHHIHRAKGPASLKVAVLSISTTRTLDEDVSGQWIVKRAIREGHPVVAHQMVTDAVTAIRQALTRLMEEPSPQAIIMTGGTGITARDVTFEAVKPLLSKELTAFGPIFSQLSFEQVDSAALLSRATAGVMDQCLVFCLPGSLKACQLACKALIFPELGHLYGHICER
ncbi:MAG: MogA/MoaB family molybdenum cofactor biosynthesis protein [Desulfatitalea sp.]|nr:MogA/MoaB family molybdenum cofactor biosynthesis protein [Desulfatitalea sp.]NNK00030.1 MogA/MoaB family molybdenum cofactor biosynthesis protein [Desulfatitalea sp.]